MCFDIGSQHLGCWGQNTSRIQNKEVYATLCLQAAPWLDGTAALLRHVQRIKHQDCNTPCVYSVWVTRFHLFRSSGHTCMADWPYPLFLEDYCWQFAWSVCQTMALHTHRIKCAFVLSCHKNVSGHSWATVNRHATCHDARHCLRVKQRTVRHGRCPLHPGQERAPTPARRTARRDAARLLFGRDLHGFPARQGSRRP